MQYKTFLELNGHDVMTTRFLIVKTSALGDIVQTFPVVQYLKYRFPDALIDWVVEERNASLVTAHPEINETIQINAKKWKSNWWKICTYKELWKSIQALRRTEYTAVFDLQGNVKSAFVMLFCKTSKKVGFGWKTAPERISCAVTNIRANPPKGQNIRRDYLFVTQSYFKDFSVSFSEEVSLKLDAHEEKIVKEWQQLLPKNSWMVCPGSSWINKQMTEKSFLQFLENVHAQYKPFFVFVAGSEKEQKFAEILSLKFPNSSLIASQLSLPVLQHIMDAMQLVLAVDALPLHLAGTTQTPTFSFFGPSVSFKYRPLGDRHFSYQGECPYNETFEKRCKYLRSCKSGACLRDLSSGALFSSFSNWWQKFHSVI